MAVSFVTPLDNNRTACMPACNADRTCIYLYYFLYSLISDIFALEKAIAAVLLKNNTLLFTWVSRMNIHMGVYHGLKRTVSIRPTGA